MSGCKDCQIAQRRIVELEEKIALLQFELDSLKSKTYKSKKIRPPEESPFINNPPKKKGGIFGHIGWFRKKPNRIDRIENVKIDKCPICGSNDLNECGEIEEHIQEDIILPVIEAVLYKRHHYYCGRCKKIVSSKGKDELPKSYIGPKAKSLAAFMKYVIKISDRDIRTIFRKVFNLDIAISSIAGFKDQLKVKALPLYEQLLESLKQSPFIHADETGWRVDGSNHWLWKFSNKRISLSHIDKGRGQKVVEGILGKDYNGTLISDFLSAYNKINARSKQRCLVHIFRDIEKVAEYWCNDKEVLRYCRRLKKILEDAILLHKEYLNKEWDERYYSKRARLKDSLKDFGFPNPNKRILKRFAKRLERHKDEMLTFLYEKNIDYHNNHAEQQIRPDVIFRKITFGNRSIKGAENHSVLMSILQTAKLNNMDPILTLEKVLLSNKGSPFSNILSPPKEKDMAGYIDTAVWPKHRTRDSRLRDLIPSPAH
jgi:transposase